MQYPHSYGIIPHKGIDINKKPSQWGKLTFGSRQLEQQHKTALSGGGISFVGLSVKKLTGGLQTRPYPEY